MTNIGPSTWMVGEGRVDSIDFVPSKNITIRGISLHRSSSGTVNYTGQIRLKEEKAVIADQRFNFTTDDSQTYFDQLFTAPGNVKAGVKYTITLSYDGEYGVHDIWRGTGGQVSVSANCGDQSVTFQFTRATDFEGESNNGSGTSVGQIPRIIFSC